jgi:multidrug resistance protein MdtO
LSLFSTEIDATLDHFRREMAFSPARLAGTLRFSLTTALATLLLLILQPPPYTIAPSLFMLFLISHDTPFNCFKDLVTCLSFAGIGTAAALCLIAATGNDPMARVFGLAVSTFLATFFFRASTVPIGALAFGCLSFMVISLWEIQVPAEQVLHLSLWPMGTLSVVAGCAVAIDYLLNRSDPAPVLQREMKARFEALEELFDLYTTMADDGRLKSQTSKVRRYAITSQGRMQALLERITKRQAYSAPALENLSALILMLSRLLDLSAAFALHNGFEEHAQARFERIGKALTAAREGHLEQIKTILGDSQTCMNGELDRFEQTLRDMAEMVEPSLDQPSKVSPGRRSIRVPRPWLAPDAFTNPAYFVYALKLSLCATICYVIYNGLKWPGISTAYFTVLFTGLTTTGATNRKLLFRIIGSTIGGLILGIGCLAFVFPNIESVTPFLLVIAAVSFIGAWVAGSSYYGYIGLQIVFSFNLLAFEGFSAPDQMTPARDRLLGILLGLIVMFFIFHQVHPERTVDTMRKSLARILGMEAEIVRRINLESSSTVPSSRVIELRTQVERMVAAIHGFSDVVKYEFEPDRTGEMTISQEILDAVSTSTNLLLSIQAVPGHVDSDSERAALRVFHESLEKGLQDLACSLEQPPGGGAGPKQRSEQLLNVPWLMVPKSVEKAIDSFRELQMLCESIVAIGA